MPTVTSVSGRLPTYKGFLIYIQVIIPVAADRMASPAHNHPWRELLDECSLVALAQAQKYECKKSQEISLFERNHVSYYVLF